MPRLAETASSAHEPRRARSSSSKYLAGLVLAATMGLSGLAHADQDAIAEQLNEEGKKLMLERNPAEAAKRFADAAARSPNPRYFYNLCKAQHFQGRFYEAMEACGNARKLNPDEALIGKLTDLEGLVKQAAKDQNIDLSKPPTQPTDPSHPTDPTNPNPTDPGHPIDPSHPVTPYPQPPRGVPPKDLYAAIAPRHEYVWTLGGELIGGSASFDTKGRYGESFAGLRIKVDYMLSPAMKLGLQGYVDFLNVSADDNSLGPDLAILNFGGALYKHFCGGALCFTPLVGLHGAAVDGTSLGENEFKTAAAGARVEAGISYALGSGYEHVIGLQFGALAYTKPRDTDTLMFDKGGTLGYVGLGYTRRFNTPFGTAPILGLE